MKRLPLLLITWLLIAGGAAAQSAERWNRLIDAEAGLAREMSRAGTLIAWLDLADTLALLQGQIAPSDADARLQAYARQVYSQEVSEAALADARSHLGNAIAGYLNASARAVSASNRWPGGVANQAEAQRLLAAVASKYPRWLQNNLNPAVLLSQVALVNGWARGETEVINPFAVHLQRVNGVVPLPQARARIAAAASLNSLDGRPVAATPLAAPAAPPPLATAPAQPPVVATNRPPSPLTMPPPRPASACQGFAGTWASHYGTMPLQVQGNRVSGSYSNPGGHIEGVINGNTLDGRWIQRDRSGPLRFVLSPDGWTLSGRWAEANGTGGGTWDARCAGPQPSAPVAAMGSPAAFEIDIDRPGQDISSFDLQQADPNHCLAACLANGSCRAYTYVKPGVQGPQPRCWIKSGVPAPVRSSCCISGVR